MQTFKRVTFSLPKDLFASFTAYIGTENKSKFIAKLLEKELKTQSIKKPTLSERLAKLQAKHGVPHLQDSVTSLIQHDRARTS